jgi:PBSX family phage terminase large subunit
MKVNLPHWKYLINERFIPLIKNRDRYLILYGGRGSSKSDCAAKKLIKRCLVEPYFRYVLYRKTYNTIKDSQFQNIKDIIYEWGLESLFTFTESPLTIKCANGNKFLCRGGDEPKKLKSIKDPTGVWYEEEIPPEADFITITTSIRTQKAEYLQEIFSINPEVEGDYTENWFWRQFFGEQISEGTWSPKHLENNFSDTTLVAMPDGTSFVRTYTAHHSTFLDNKWIPDSFIAQLIDLQRTNPYYYTIYALGLWGNKSTDGNFYKLFNRNKNVLPKAHDYCQYDPDIPLRLTFDFNVKPYMTLCIHQMVGMRSTQIDEMCLPTPNNKTEAVCRKFISKYKEVHKSSVYVYGDPSGVQEDTRTEKGFNDFVIIQRELYNAGFKVIMQYEKKAPPVHMRGLFINEVFANNYDGIELFISEVCFNTISDYTMLKEAADGTKSKIKVKDIETKITYEKYGHTSDANDYLYCVIFYSSFVKYQRTGSLAKFTTGRNRSKNSY